MKVESERSFAAFFKTAELLELSACSSWPIQQVGFSSSQARVAHKIGFARICGLIVLSSLCIDLEGIVVVAVSWRLFQRNDLTFCTIAGRIESGAQNAQN